MPLSKLVIALSLAFGFFLLAVAAEVWYLLCWRKRRTHAATEIDHNNDAKGMLYGACWKTPSTTNPNPESENTDLENKNHEPDLELGTTNGNDVMLKTFEDEGVEAELMRLHNLAGPPRFLFTIKEETKEDLESEDGKSRCDHGSRKGSRTRSLSDLMVAIDTPFLNPVASSTLKSSLDSLLDSYKRQGFNFNPLFESNSVESELNGFRSSPPPKFKFLRDAEEKLFRRLIEEARRKAQINVIGSVPESEIKDSLNSTIQQHLPEFPSSSSKASIMVR